MAASPSIAAPTRSISGIICSDCRGLRTLNLNRDLPAQIRSLAVFAGWTVLIPQGFAGSDPIGAIRELLRHAPPKARFFFPLAADSLDEARRLSDDLRPLLGRA